MTPHQGGDRLDVRNYLRENDLRLTWLQSRLRERGYTVEISHLCRIVGGERQSEQALEILSECRSICGAYENLKKSLN